MAERTHGLSFSALLALRADVARGRPLRRVAEEFGVSLRVVVWATRGVHTPEDLAAAAMAAGAALGRLTSPVPLDRSEVLAHA